MPQRAGNRKVVYTFIFGDYDELKSPTVITPGWDYICFTDNRALSSKFWDVRLSLPQSADQQIETKKYAMKHMILFHHYLQGYDLSLSIGAQLRLKCNLDDLMREHFTPGDDMMICRHEKRDCVYDEAELCKAMFLDDSTRIDAHMQRYRASGYPAHSGLYTSRIIARWHDRQNVKDMCEFWWKEYLDGSRRDQLSLNYAIWKSAPIKISVVDYAQQFGTRLNFEICHHKNPVHIPAVKIEFKFEDINSRRKLLTLASFEHDFVGYLDIVNHYGIYGWAADRTRLNNPIEVTLCDEHKVIMTMLADRPRPDVGAALGDNGLHGFAIETPACFNDGTARKLIIKPK